MRAVAVYIARFAESRSFLPSRFWQDKARVRPVLIAVVLILGVARSAIAGGPITTPELDGSTIQTALVLLGSGVMIMRLRKR